MEFYVLSLPEATGLYMGLALQHLLRVSVLGRWAPVILVLIGCMRLLTGRVGRRDPSQGPVQTGWYLGISALILICFWPEASGFSFGSQLLDGSQVASYAASQDPQATVITAADTGDATAPVVLETPGFHLILQALTQLPLAIARQLNQRTHQAFSPLIGMSWLVGMEMTANVSRALTDWVEACWKPSMLQDQEFQEAIRAQDLVPWGDTPVARALATREAVPGAMTGGGYLRDNGPLGTMFLSNPGTGAAVRCDVYLAAVQLEVGRWLQTETSPNGTPLAQVFEQDTGKTVEQQAQFLIYREALRALGRPSPAPSLAGTYGALSAAKAVTGVGSGAMGSVGTKVGGWLGGLLGGGQAVLNQFDGAIQTLLWAVGIAMWFVYWSPFLFGFALQQLIGLFPIIVCYSLLPESQFKPLIYYFLALAYVCCAPLWLALVDLASRWGASLAPVSQDAILSLFNWAPAQVYGVVVTVIGLFLVHVIGAGVLFASGRGMVQALRQ